MLAWHSVQSLPGYSWTDSMLCWLVDSPFQLVADTVEKMLWLSKPSLACHMIQALAEVFSNCVHLCFCFWCCNGCWASFAVKNSLQFVPSSVQNLCGKDTVLLMLQDGENSSCNSFPSSSQRHQNSDRSSTTRHTTRNCNNNPSGTSSKSTLSLSAVLASYMATASIRPMIQVGLHLLGDSVDLESVANCMALVRVCHHAMHGSSDLRQDSFRWLWLQNVCCDAYRPEAEQWSCFCQYTNTQQISEEEVCWVLVNWQKHLRPSYEGAFEPRLTLVCYIHQ